MVIMKPLNPLSVAAADDTTTSNNGSNNRLAHPEGFSPAGLKVLVVDDDLLCLMILERMLRQCKYAVTTCNSATKALAMLRENRNYFDLVLSDVYMPDMDGFKLLEAIGLELDLPVIMMSGDGETDLVMKGIRHGACDYLLKPVRLEELKNIWQHVVRKLVTPRDLPKEESGEWDEFTRPLDADLDATSRKRKERVEDENQLLDDVNNLKKARVVWSAELHQQFVNAVDFLGVDKAVPRKILDIMNVQGLTRENVASHLQKYRLYLKRLIGVTPQPYPVASFRASDSGPFGGTMQIQPGGRPTASTSSKGLNLGSGGGALSTISGLSRGESQIDAATLNTLVHLQNLQQQQQQQHAAAAARGGGGGGLAAELGNPLTPTDPIGLQRMDSFDLDLLMKAQHDVSRQQRSGGPEFAALLNGSGKDVLPYLNSLRGQSDLKPLPPPSAANANAEPPITAMSMSNLQGVDDVGPSLASMETARNLLVNKLGASFTSTSAFSSSTTTHSNGNGGAAAAVSESSFSTNYGDLGDVPPEYLVTSPSDLSLLGQLQAFDQGEVDYGQSPHPRRPMSYS